MAGDPLFLTDLRDRVRRRKAILVIGAGASIAATRNKKSVASWRGLLRHGVERAAAVARVDPDWKEIREHQLASSSTSELISAADAIASVLGAPKGGEYSLWLRETVGKLHEDDLAADVPAAVGALDIPIATTNYDSILSKVLGRPAYTWRDVHAVDRWIRGDEDGIVHLHGLWSAAETVVLGVKSYEEVVRDPHTNAILQAMWTTNTLIFVGFGAGLDDPNFTALLRWARTAHANSEYRHYRLALDEEVDQLRRQQDEDDHIAIVGYGASHDRLAPFLLDLAERPAVAARAAHDVQRFHVPYASKGNRVIGRDRSIEAVSRALAANDSPVGSVAALTGIGGLGKTQTAVEYCYAARNVYVDGVLWFDCSRDVDTQMIRIAEASGWAHPEATAADKLAIAQHRLSQLQQVLIVLDDVEQIDSLRDVFFVQAPASRHLLMTSRLPIPGFATLDMTELALTPADAVRLLRSESRREAIAENDPDAVELVGLFDHLPLAIEITGAFLRDHPSVSLKAYAAEIKKRGFEAAGQHPTAISSFTKHTPNVREAVEIADAAISSDPLLGEILKCFGVTPATSIGRSLLAAMLQCDEHDVAFDAALDRGVHLRFLSREASAEDRWRMHRLVWQVYSEKARATVDDAAMVAMAERVAEWFAQRHEEISQLAEFEVEAEQIRFWHRELATLNHSLAARIAWMEAYLPYHRARFAEALELLREAFEIIKGDARADPALKVRVLCDLATMLRQLSRHDEALPHAFEAATLARGLAQPQLHEARMWALRTLASIQIEFGDYEDALRNAQEALAYSSTSTSRLETIRMIADALGYLDRTDEALSILSEMEKAASWTPDERARLERDLGELHLARGETHAALERIQRAYDLSVEVFGETHPVTMVVLTDLASAHRETNHLDLAEHYALRALDVALRTFGPMNQSVAGCHARLGSIYSRANRWHEALEQRVEALKITETLRGRKDPETAETISLLAATYAGARDYSRATLLYREAFEIFDQRLGSGHSTTITCVIDWSRAIVNMGNLRGAYALLQQHARTVRPDHPKRKILDLEMKSLRDSGKLPGFRAKPKSATQKKR